MYLSNRDWTGLRRTRSANSREAQPQENRHNGHREQNLIIRTDPINLCISSCNATAISLRSRSFANPYTNKTTIAAISEMETCGISERKRSTRPRHQENMRRLSDSQASHTRGPPDATVAELQQSKPSNYCPCALYLASVAAFAGRHHCSLAQYHSMVATKPAAKSVCAGRQSSSRRSLAESMA